MLLKFENVFVCKFLFQSMLNGKGSTLYSPYQAKTMLVSHLIYMKRNKHKSSAHSTRSAVACILIYEHKFVCANELKLGECAGASKYGNVAAQQLLSVQHCSRLYIL